MVQFQTIISFKLIDDNKISKKISFSSCAIHLSEFYVIVVDGFNIFTMLFEVSQIFYIERCSPMPFAIRVDLSVFNFLDFISGQRLKSLLSNRINKSLVIILNKFMFILDLLNFYLFVADFLLIRELLGSLIFDIEIQWIDFPNLIKLSQNRFES